MGNPAMPMKLPMGPKWLQKIDFGPYSSQSFNKPIQVFLNFQFPICLAHVVLK
jgi:hypothetical protein